MIDAVNRPLETNTSKPSQNRTLESIKDGANEVIKNKERADNLIEQMSDPAKKAEAEAKIANSYMGILEPLAQVALDYSQLRSEGKSAEEALVILKSKDNVSEEGLKNLETVLNLGGDIKNSETSDRVLNIVLTMRDPAKLNELLSRPLENKSQETVPAYLDKTPIADI